MTRVPERQFGRRPSPPDPRDRLWLMDVPHADRQLPQARTWRYAVPVLDQQDRPHCVAYAWTAMLLATPMAVRSGFPFGTAHGIGVFTAGVYAEAQTLDAIPGEDYDGTTVRGGAKALAKRGFLASYLWAWDAETVVRYLLTRGPVVLGIEWTADMMTPKGGVIRPTGRSYGGHAILAIGCDTRRGMVRLLNSWGASWGDNGRAWLTIADLDRLMQDGGEACSGIEATRRPQ